jgi:hypothetical protein
MLIPSSFRFLSLAPLLLTAMVGCSTAPAALEAAQQTNPAPLEEARPPTLPIAPVNTPLPVLQDGAVAQNLRASAAASSKVQLRLLLISPTRDNPGLEALEALCDQVGTPCDSLIAATTPLTQEALVAANGEGRYQGIFLTDNQLAYAVDGGYQSAFDATEWNLLWGYARDYGVRQVSLYTFPGTFPESYGITVSGYQDTTDAAYTTTLTPAGEAVFSSLKKGVNIPVRYAYTYLAQADASAGVEAQPLLRDAAGNALAVTSTTADGRERLALTMAHNPYLLHTQLLGYDLLRWVTKGVFIGQRNFYFGVDQDDWFAPTEMWDAAVGGISGEYRLNAQDVLGVVQQQRKLRRDYPFAKNFAWTMAFNGNYANTSAPRDCNVRTKSVDPLTSLTLCYKNEFFWLNHTWNHEYMDRASYDLAASEIGKNTLLALKLGLVTKKYSIKGLVTGDVSGLGWYAPGGPDTGPKVDHGLEASNREFLKAAGDLGVRYLASNMSTKSHEPVDCWGCGITHPLDGRIFLIPRWPTNLFATPTTPEDMMDAYNRVYGPSGSDPYFSKNLSYDEYLDFEADIALYHIITGSPYQHYQHVGNLREYAPGRSLAYDWADRVLAKYSRYYNLPVQTLNWDQLGKAVQDRTSFKNAGASGVWDTATNQVSLSAARGGPVFFNAGPAAKTTKTSLATGQTRVLSLR